MTPHHLARAFALLLMPLLTGTAAQAQSASPGQPAPSPATLVIKTAVLNPVDARLFGQFMEVASWGEPGPDAIADPDTGRLPDDVIQLLQWMNIPVIRWPGGTDISHTDWTDRIDGVPGRGGGPRVPTRVGNNPISNCFSHDAFLELCATLEAQPMMVLNLKDLLAGKKTLEEATAHAAAFVAYCNAKTDADLPAELLAWAKLREQNGRAEPWNVPYFQIGNEGFFYIRDLAHQAGHTQPQAQATWLADHVVALAQAMKAVDPAIEIIYDGNLGGGTDLTGFFYQDDRVKQWIDYPTLHSYYPMNDYQPARDGQDVYPEDLTLEQLHYLWQFGPGHWENREILASAPGWRVAQIQGPLAHTEWNWNGFGDKLAINQFPREASVASALAVAAHLNGMIRQGDRFKIGNQSMLVGTSWNINALRADPTGKQTPFLTPTGLTTGLYSRLHGDQRLDLDLHPPPTTSAVAGFEVHAYGNARAPGTPTFPLLDAVATADDQHLYLHLAHRSFAQPTPLRIDLTAFGLAHATAQVHLLLPRDPQDMARDDRPPLDSMHYHSTPAPINQGILEINLPASAVIILKIPR